MPPEHLLLHSGGVHRTGTLTHIPTPWQSTAPNAAARAEALVSAPSINRPECINIWVNKAEQEARWRPASQHGEGV